MTTQGFAATHAKDAHFERGLRAFFEYRDLGIKAATQGRFAAHVIRAAAGTDFASQPHLHRTEFQFVDVLKGWIEFEYEGQGRVRLEAGSCVHQPPGSATVSWGTATMSRCSRSCCRRTLRPKKLRRSMTSRGVTRTRIHTDNLHGRRVAQWVASRHFGRQD